ncbi:MAG: DNA polymerase I, partial [Ruminococcaceae bacterium]|nr:DNA polymerase I [Oscillospiraceae bacterium]
TMLAAYLVNPSASDYSLERLTEQYLGASELRLPPMLAAAQSAIRLRPLCATLAETLEQCGMTPLLRDVELPLACVLADMEHAGFAVDTDGIEQFGKTLEERAAQLEQSIHAEVGYEFNIGSPKQLGEALFGKLQLPGGKKTKTGYSTSADVLDGLRGQHPLIDMILEYRSLTKLVSTYCKGLVKCVQPDGRIHTSFNQTETRTGRISSAEPNMQNIPVRTELGRELRRFFAAKEGCVLIDADYSQIELRVLAHMAHDTTMIDTFNNGADIHRLTAAQVFGIPPEMVTPQMRSNAKAVNFGIIYGISAFSLGKDIGTTTKGAQQYIDGYMATYPAIAAFMSETVSQARKDGYVQTMYGRRRYLPELAASNFNTRSFGERVARNMPIQGTAADIIKIAMVRVWQRLRSEEMESRLILQVHDELIIEAPEAEAEKATAILTEEMEAAAQLAVKLEAEAHSGRTWLEAKG